MRTLRRRFNRWLFWFSRTRAGTLIVQGVFAYMSFLLPVERLRETSHLIAFYHPRPVYPVHILIVPKKGITRMVDLSTEDSPFLLDLFQTVKTLVAELDLEQPGYRLMTNGGGYQDVQQLHFHLVSGVTD